MKKLILGIAEFRRKKLPDFEKVFATLALGQFPDALFIACSDSRVAANVFASTDPGDIFVVRNVGNLIPLSDVKGKSTGDESEAAAIEFALASLNVKNIIICGHSECGAINALIKGRENVPHPNLKSWLRHADGALSEANFKMISKGPKEHHNFISQVNVLIQIENLKSYPIVRERLEAGTLKLNAWWFDLNTVGVHYYDEAKKEFLLIDEEKAQELISKLYE